MGSAWLVAVGKQGKWMWLSTEMSRAVPGFIAAYLAAHSLSVSVILTGLQFNDYICRLKPRASEPWHPLRVENHRKTE